MRLPIRPLATLVLTLIAGITFFTVSPVFQAYTDLTFFSLFLFVLLTLIIVFLAPRLARQPKGQPFLGLVVYSILLKIGLAFVVLLLYREWKHPASGNFVLPFLFIYLVFTIFETWYLMKVSYLSHHRKSENTN